MRNEKEFSGELTRLLNKYCVDNFTNTPDFILSELLVAHIKFIEVFNEARDQWQGFKNLNSRSKELEPKNG